MEEKPQTIRMKKGDIFADIHNSEECIAQAISEGYQVVKESEKPVEKNVEKVDEKPATRKTGKNKK